MDFIFGSFNVIGILLSILFVGAVIYFIYEKVTGKEKDDFEDRPN